MIKLEKFTSKHFEDLISWVDNEEELMQFAGPAYTFPLTKEQLDTSLKDNKRYAFAVIDTGKNIGHCEIYLKDSSIHLGRILIGDKTQRGKGIGKQIVNKLLEFGFDNFDKTVAELNVFDWNNSAIKCYEGAGFVINKEKSIERNVNNKIWTAVNMKLDKEQWKRKQSRKEEL